MVSPSCPVPQTSPWGIANLLLTPPRGKQNRREGAEAAGRRLISVAMPAARETVYLYSFQVSPCAVSNKANQG